MIVLERSFKGFFYIEYSWSLSSKIKMYIYRKFKADIHTNFIAHAKTLRIIQIKTCTLTMEITTYSDMHGSKICASRFNKLN